MKFAVTVAALATSTAIAADTQWLPGSGNWLTPAKWTAGVPTDTSNAIFNLLGVQTTVTLDEPGPITAGRITVQRGNVEFAGLASLDLMYENAFTPTLTVGTLAGETGILALSGPPLVTAANVDIATVNQAVGVLAIPVTSELDVAYSLRVGVLGQGSLLSNRPIRATSLTVGVGDSGYGLIAGYGSTFPPTPPGNAARIDVESQFTIGLFGTGEVRSGTAGFSCGSLMLGQNDGATGTLTATGPIDIGGRVTVGKQGFGILNLTSTMSARGGLTLALQGANPIDPPTLLSNALVTLTGGRIVAGRDVMIGLAGNALVTMSGAASIESTEKMTMNSGSPPIEIALPTIPNAYPTLGAPTMVGVRCELTIEGAPALGSVWHIARVFSGALPSCTVNSNPGAGQELRLISCATDLFLALVESGSASPTVCPNVEVPTDVADAYIATSRATARLFGSGGVVIGDGWYAVGCPGPGVTAIGGVDVYRAVNGQWIFHTTLVSPEPGFILGAALAADGNRLATRSTDGTRVVIFERFAGSWGLQGVIVLDPQTPTTGAIQLRRTLALSGSTLAIGDPHRNAPSPYSTGDVGAAHVYVEKGSAWVLQEILRPDFQYQAMKFGAAVSYSQDRLSVGGLLNSTITNFVRTGSGAGATWTLEGYVTASTTASDVALTGIDLVTAALPYFWRSVDGVWTDAGAGSTGSSMTSMGKVSFDGATAAYLGDNSISTYNLGLDGAWRMGQLRPFTGPKSGIALRGPIMCVASTTGVLVYGDTPAVACPPDFDQDGSVGGSDLSFILSSWDTSPLGDLNGDGVTDGIDLTTLLAAWGECP